MSRWGTCLQISTDLMLTSGGAHIPAMTWGQLRSWLVKLPTEQSTRVICWQPCACLHVPSEAVTTNGLTPNRK